MGGYICPSSKGVFMFKNFVDIFYDDTDGSLTVVGVFALMGLGIGIVSLGIAFVQRLIKR